VNGSIIELRNISKAFHGVPALDNVDLQVGRGTVHALLGENGAGKSTLVKIISGAYQKDSGEILVGGEKIDINNPQDAIKLGIGVIYQEFNLVPQLTVFENILLGREPQTRFNTIDRNKMRILAEKILQPLGIDLDLNSPVIKLGVAQQQMVEVAKALSLDADLLIMDEPTSALTRTEIEQLFTLIRKLKETGVSIIYISHRLDELFEIVDEVTVLRDGRQVGKRDMNKVSKNELIKLMVDREIIDIYPVRDSQIRDEALNVSALCKGSSLTNISFTLHRGEILGVAGLLGSGRTELARAIFGVDAIDSGIINVHGKKTTIASPRKAIDKGIGLLTEDRKNQGLVMQLSVKDNICMAHTAALSRWGFVRTKEEIKEARSFIRELRIKTTGVDQKTLYLSGGNQQKIVMSKWLCTKAEILIFDEPTRGIDIGSKVEIYNLMNRLVDRGTAILMISSELPELIGMSDRILVMRQGRIVGEFSPEETDQEKILQAALGVIGEA
jgi:ribose transport system ATP-binding protein